VKSRRMQVMKRKVRMSRKKRKVRLESKDEKKRERFQTGNIVLRDSKKSRMRTKDRGIRNKERSTNNPNTKQE
jgi:hypothetical protein